MDGARAGAGAAGVRIGAGENAGARAGAGAGENAGVRAGPGEKPGARAGAGAAWKRPTSGAPGFGRGGFDTPGMGRAPENAGARPTLVAGAASKRAGALAPSARAVDGRANCCACDTLGAAVARGTCVAVYPRRDGGGPPTRTFAAA